MNSQPRPSDDLIALALGELTGPERTRVESTLDDASRAMVQRLRALVSTIGDASLEPAPAPLITRLNAIGLTSTLAETIGQVTGAIRRLVATITFDSRVNPALAGFRGSAEGRQLVFTSRAGDVHLRLSGPTEADPRITIRGSVEASGDGAPLTHGAYVRLDAQGAAPASADAPTQPLLDDDGMFVLRAYPGIYQLAVCLGQTEIDLGMLDLA